MKKTLLVAGLMALAIGTYGQGTVNFNNFISGVLRSPIYDVEPGNPTAVMHGNGPSPSIPAGSTTYNGALLAGTGFSVTLWGAEGSSATLGQMAQLNTTNGATAVANFRTGTGAGLVNTTSLPLGNPLLAVPLANGIDGNPYRGTFQVRAWNNLNGTITTWAQVMANPAVARGMSDLFSPSGALGGTDTPPATPPNLIGLTSFNLAIVPEPSLIALGALGLGALLLRRRKA